MFDTSKPATTADAAARSKRLTVDLTRDLHRRLKTAAARQEITMADVVRRILAEWLEREAGRQGRGS